MTKSHLAAVVCAALLGISGCAAPDEAATDPLGVDVAAQSTTCRSFSLSASKEYHPAHSTDGVRSFAPGFGLAIPGQIPVTAGRSGGHANRVRLEITSGSQVDSCVYRGASHGSRYDFASCQSGRSPGAVLLADRLSLHVVEGDKRAGTTTVTLDASEAAPCGGPPPPAQLFTLSADAGQFATLERIGLDGSVQPLFGVGVRFTGLASASGDTGFYTIATDATGFSTLERIELSGAVQPLFGVGFGFTGGLALDPDGGLLYALSCDATSFCTIQSINLNGQVLPLFGVGFRFSGLTYDATGRRFLAMASDAAGFSTLTSIQLNGAVQPLFGVGYRFTGGLAQSPTDPSTFYALSSDATGFSSINAIGLNGAIQPLFGIGNGFANAALVVR